MKKFAVAAAALTMIAAPGLAMAQSTSSGLSSSAVPLTANVASLCGVGNQSGGGAHNPGVLTPFANIIDANGFLNTSAVATISFGNIWCNGKSDLELSATKFTSNNTTTDVSSFAKDLDLVVSDAGIEGNSIFVYFGNQTTFTTGTILKYTMNQAFETGSGNFNRANVRLALPAGHSGNDRPLAGTYTGSVTLTVKPAA